MKEKDFQTKFNLWLRNRWSKGTAAFELKLTKEKSLRFDAVQEHQVRNLLYAKQTKLAYKIPDVGFDQKPFDCFVLSQSLAYVVIMFYTRGTKHFYMIDIHDFEHESLHSDRSSLTEERAGQIGEKIYMK